MSKCISLTSKGERERERELAPINQGTTFYREHVCLSVCLFRLWYLHQPLNVTECMQGEQLNDNY